MTNKQIRLRSHRIPESVDNSKLSRFIKIYKNVSAENNIQVSCSRIILQIVIVKSYGIHYFFFNLITALNFCKILFKIILRNSIYLGICIKALLSYH